MLSDFEYWKSKEEIIILRLETYFWLERINKKDKPWVFEKYEPDIEMWYWWREYKVEIKYTQKPLKYIEWKKNQKDYAENNNGYLLQVAWGKIYWINPTDKNIYKEKWYCNKPVYSFYPKHSFNTFEELFNYLTR